MCFHIPTSQTSADSYPILYHDIADQRAILLETRAKFMLQARCYKTGETALSIREVIYGHEHPQTCVARLWLRDLLRF